jgi:hypothetical protein
MRRWVLAAGALALVACDDASTGGQDAAGGAGGAVIDAATGGTGGAGGTGGMPDATVADMAQPDMEQPTIEWTTPDGVAEPVENPPANNGECRATFVGAFRGWIADQSGYPVRGAKAQACVIVEPGSTLICLRPADVDDNGVYTVSVPENSACISSVAMRVLKPGAGLATNYCNEVPADVVGADGVIRTTDPYVIYPTDPAAEVPEGALDDTVTVRYEDGLEVDVTAARYFPTSGSLSQARARKIDPADRGLCFLEGQPAPDGLYAFWPEAAIDDAGYPVRIPNTDGLAAGAKVSLFVVGGLECGTEAGVHIPEGEWFEFGTGTVTADGATIASDAGSELPCFTWLGYKAQ